MIQFIVSFLQDVLYFRKRMINTVSSAFVKLNAIPKCKLKEERDEERLMQRRRREEKI